MGFFLIKPQDGQGPTSPDSGLAAKLIVPSCLDHPGLQSTWSCMSAGLCPAQLAGDDL